MRNFTKQITNKTLFKPTRWLIMALMMLVGTSSAWAETYLAGDFNSWDSANNSYKFSFSGDNGTLSITLNAKSTYNFKIVQDGNWRTNSNAGTMKRDNCTGWDFSTIGGNDNNTKIVTDIQSTYVFKYNKTTNTLSITYPNIDKVFIKGGMNNWGSDECTSEGDGIFKKSYSSNNNTEFKFVANNGSNWDGEGLYNTMSVDETKNTSALKLTRSDNGNTKITNTAGTAFDIVINTQTGKYWIEAPSCTTPTFTISGPNQICEGTNGHEYTIANPAVASGVTYAWSNDLVGVTSESTTDNTYTFNTSANGAKTGKITVTATNGACTHTETKNISQIAKPTAGNLSITSANLEIGDTKTINVTGANGGTKSWSSDKTNVATVDDNGIVTAIAAGTATITYTVQPSLTGCGSAATATATINVCAPPDAFTISIDKTAICSGGNATITIPNDHSAESYKWCTKNGNDYGAVTPINDKSFTVSTAGTYVVRAYNGNGTCMTESNPVTLTVDEKPTITVTEPSTICSGSEIDLSDYVKTDKGTLTYNNNSQSVFTPNENTTYNIVATNGACSATSTITVSVANETKPQPVALSGPYNRINCWAIEITVNNNDSILAVLYEGYEITPTPVVDGTKYKKGDIIGEGKVVHKDKANAIVIEGLEPEQDYTCVIYQYTNTCKIYSDPLVIPFKKNVPEFTPIKITPNGTSVTLSTEATHIGTNIAGVVIDKANFYYKKTNDAKWTEIAATETGGKNEFCTATITNLIQGATYQFKFEASNNSCTENKVTVEGTEDVTIECPTVTPPTLTDAAYCGSQNSVTLPPVSGYWYDSQTDGNKVTSPVNVANTTTYYATSKDGECESVRVPYIITINPVPTITVDAGNETPVLNQEVLLTASGDNIASVAWSVNKGSITPNLDDSKKAILTHNSAETVTVTATATSAAGCKSTAANYRVNFEAEGECEHEIINDPNKTKVRVKKINNWSTIKIYAHSGQSTGDWPGADMTAGTGEDADYYVYTFESVSSDFKVIFNNGSSNGENQTVSGTATKGKVCTYTIGANSCSEDNNSRRCLTVTTTDYKTNGDVIISAPAVNTVSVTSQVGSGVVNFTGQVVKTGCAAPKKIYVGYQYRLATEPWPNNVTAGNAKGDLIVVPDADGKTLDETYSATISGLADGKYVFRAYIINGYNFTNGNYNQGVYYGLDKLVTVSLQQQAITSVTIEHAGIDGKTITDPTYCAGTTAYIKLDHDGTPYKGDVVWTSTANHDFSKVEGKENLFSYTVKGEDNVTASVKNDENNDYVSSEPLNVKVYPVPNMPNFDISKTTICSTGDDGAVITVTNPQVGITYQVYKKVGDNETAHGNPVTYNNGDLTINSIKTAGTYFVKAWNKECDNKVERSLTEAEVTIVDAAANSIAITPTSKEVNPWMPTTFIVNKTGSYNYTLTCTQTNAQEGSATKGNIEYNYSFVPTNNGVQVTFTWTNKNDITGAVAPILQDKTTGTTNELRGTDNSVTKLITPNAQGNVIVAAKFEFAGGSQTTADYTYTNQGDVPASDAIITKKGDTYIIKFPKPADAQIENGQVTFNPIQYNVTAKLNVDVQGCGTTVATSNVTLTPLTEVCP